MKRLNLNVDDRTAERLAEQMHTEERSATEIVRRSLEMYFEHGGKWCCSQHPTLAEQLRGRSDTDGS